MLNQLWNQPQCCHGLLPSWAPNTEMCLMVIIFHPEHPCKEQNSHLSHEKIVSHGYCMVYLWQSDQWTNTLSFKFAQVSIIGPPFIMDTLQQATWTEYCSLYHCLSLRHPIPKLSIVSCWLWILECAGHIPRLITSNLYNTKGNW